MAVSDIRGDVIYYDTVTFSGTLVIPDDTIDNDAVSASAAIVATKLEHQFPLGGQQVDDTTAITAGDELIHVVRGATGDIVSIESVIITAATAADRTVTMDLHKSTGAGAFATVLTTTVNITNATSVLTPVAGVLNSSMSGLVDGDILKLVWTVAGSNGAQAKGLVTTVFIREDPA